MSPWQPFAELVASNPWWTIGFLLAGCLLLFHDLLTPLTWGWTGSLGTLCIAVVFVAQRTSGREGWTGIALLLAGLSLLLLEIHVFRGSGVAALCGFALLFAGMFSSLGGTARAAFALPIASGLSLMAITAFFAFLPKSTIWREIAGSRSGMLPDGAPVLQPIAGNVGRTTTPLRPSGEALIAGRRFAVVTEGDFLPAGADIVVSRVDGDRIQVDAASGSPGAVGPGYPG